MSTFVKELEQLLTIEAFSILLNSNTVKISQLNAIISFLIKACIPFTLTFSSGTREKAGSARLTITISPAITLQFTFTFDPCVCFQS
ncbi:MAG: hypothetical protein ACOY30_03805 [Bacillota bacterium]